MSHDREPHGSRAFVGSNGASSRCYVAVLFLLTTVADAGVVKPDQGTRPRLQGSFSQSVVASSNAVMQHPPQHHSPGTRGQYSSAPSGSNSGSNKGGTACQCVCGDRVVWHREVFEGDVVALKEHECEHEICPRVTVPGLKVRAQCTYVEDISELTAGTVCNCQCGDRIVWRNRAFYGDVRDKMERECLKKICPRVNPIPGYRFYAHCIFDRHLFAAPVHQPPKAFATRSALTVSLAIGVASFLAWAGLLF